MRWLLILVGVVLVGVLGTLAVLSYRNDGSNTPAREPAWFEDVTQRVGLRFRHDPGATGTFFTPQIMGSGAAVLDIDGDGRLDIYLIQNAGPDSGSKNQLYQQKADGTFENISAGSGLDVAGFGMGAAVGDIDNDGRPDVLLTEYGGVRLFRNKGDRTFDDITERAGIVHSYWGTSACFFDYNRDGRLDFVVANYVKNNPSQKCTNPSGEPDYCSPYQFPGSPSSLFENLGPDKDGVVRFRNVSRKSGIASKDGPALGVFCADFDGDGWPDILVANDESANHLWINKKDGTFADEGVIRGLAFNGKGDTETSMGIGVGDVDDNGLFDVFLTHMIGETNTLYFQEEPGRFRDRTSVSGIVNGEWRGTGFGTVMVDFDRDGRLDIALVNGRVGSKPVEAGKPPKTFWEKYTQRNQVFASAAAGKFRDVSESNPAFCGYENVGRGLVYADFDNDGALDMLATEIGGPARLFRNVVPNPGHWLSVRAVDPRHGGRDAYGAVVTVVAGKRRWIRWMNPCSSYLCSNDPRAHFGLGNVSKIDKIVVQWPDGKRQTFPGGKVNEHRVLSRSLAK